MRYFSLAYASIRSTRCINYANSRRYDLTPHKNIFRNSQLATRIAETGDSYGLTANTAWSRARLWSFESCYKMSEIDRERTDIHDTKFRYNQDKSARDKT